MADIEMSLEDQKKLVVPFMQRAQEMERTDPKMAYYCRLHAIDQAVSIPKRAKEVNAVVTATLSKLEKDKANLVLDKEQDRFHCEAFALRVFANADRIDRAGRGDVNTAKAFYAASCFLDVLNQFGPLDADLLGKQKYALWRAAEIRKAVREGRPPVPPPASTGNVDLQQLGDMAASSGPSDASFTGAMAGIQTLDGGAAAPGGFTAPPAPPPPAQSFHYPTELQPGPGSDSGAPYTTGYGSGGGWDGHASGVPPPGPPSLGGYGDATSDGGSGTPSMPPVHSDQFQGFNHLPMDSYSTQPPAPLAQPPLQGDTHTAWNSAGGTGGYPAAPPDSRHAQGHGTVPSSSGWGQPPAPIAALPAGAGFVNVRALPPGHKASVQAIAEAQKAARTAVSSLNFEDVASAVKYLLHAVDVLTAPPNTPVKKL